MAAVGYLSQATLDTYRMWLEDGFWEGVQSQCTNPNR